jgi:SNF2 family DNA or RNA helicase
LDRFEAAYGNLQDESSLTSLQEAIRPYLLRRMKEDVEKGLPPKEETIIDVELTGVQKQYYRYSLSPLASSSPLDGNSHGVLLLLTPSRPVPPSLPPSFPPSLRPSVPPSLPPLSLPSRAIYEKNVEFLLGGRKAVDGPSLMNLCMELRKCCNHPFLNKGVELDIRSHAEATGKVYASDADLLVQYR